MENQFKVLVVDDDPGFLRLMDAYLSRLHCRFFLMPDARQAAQFLEENDVDLCFMDFVMPDMDGVALVRIIRKNLGKNFPIIAVSAYDMYISADQCCGAGMADVVRKPLLFEDVKRIVLRYVGEKNNEQQIRKR